MTEIILIITLVIVIATLFGSIGGYMEVQVLCEQTRDEEAWTSWQWDDYKKKWYWSTDQNDKKKRVYDSAHISEGALYAMMAIALTLVLYFALGLEWYLLLILPILFWLYLFWIRNIWMHVILKVKPLWYYLIPVFGKLLEKENE
jgi:hypothetical protein